MNYRRALFLVDPERDSAPAIAVLRRVAARLDRLVVVAPATASGSLDALHAVAAGAAASVEVQLELVLDRALLHKLCVAEEIDLVVFSSRTLRSVSMVAARRLPTAVLWADGKAGEGPVTKLGCLALDESARIALGAFLRDHGDRSVHASLLAPRPVAPDELRTAVEVQGIRSPIAIASPDKATSLRQWIEAWTRDNAPDLLVVAGLPTALLLRALLETPVLLIPTLPSARPLAQRAFDLADLLADGGPLRVRLEQVAMLGSCEPVPDQTFAFVAGGRVIAEVTTLNGEAELPAGIIPDSLGVYRAGAPIDPLAAIEHQIVVIQRGAPLILGDAELSAESLRALAAEAELLVVRLRPSQSCRRIRQRLRALGLPARVVDARTVLDEGEALDVSRALDALRLERVAERLRRAGFPILRSVAVEPLPAAPPVPSTISEGNRVGLELDNALARRWLLEAIERSQRSLHLQVYMGLYDDIGQQVEAALGEAAARGVAVRVLVDSLHGLHGSFGAENPLFARLAARAGIELRALAPITELPSIADMKQRDHRKLVVADGRTALLGGRNLSHEYYTAFEEAAITAASMWREVPWLDAGARVEGPAVAALERAFGEAWTAAGGAPLTSEGPPPIGTTRTQVIVHHGLRDARTLEAYRELIDTARAHIYVVNGFPLVLELQHALLRALRRGIRVRVLSGHPSPTHGGQTFGGPWATARTFATELVHSRLDPIVAADGEVFLFARQDVPGWEPGLGAVHPHVHAKALSVDGRRCLVGSANLDITASYWESELLLLIEDAPLAAQFEAQIEACLAASRRMTKDDPAWQELARRRRWMRNWPGLLSV